METKDYKKSINKELKKDKLEKNNYSWIIRIVIIAFFLAIVFTALSESIIPSINIIVGIIILIVFILLGVTFDLIGVAVNVADEKPFHSMNSRRIKSADIACLLKKNSEKVSAFCCDVVGDICGIISGTTASIIAISVASTFGLDKFITALLVTGLVSSLTIGGKALGKSFAVNKSNYILYEFSKIINKFYKIKK